MPAPVDPEEFAELAQQLGAQHDEQLTARTIVDRMVAVVPEAGSVSLTVRISGRQHRTLASSDELAARSDGLQYELGEGPCVETADHGGWLRSADVGSDPRWPRWGPRARDLGVGSLLSVQLLIDERPEGALTAYSRGAGAFQDADSVDLALVFAVHAAHALSSARLVTDLRTALSSRHAIGIAQGILMERLRIGQDQSFAMLHRLAEQTGTPVPDLAAEIAATRRLPGLDDVDDDL